VAITFIVGVLVLLSYFVTGNIPGTAKTFRMVSTDITGWGVVVSAFALGLASANLYRIHTARIVRQRPGFHNSVLLVISMTIFALLGIYNKLSPNNKASFQLFRDIFDYLYSPLGTAMFAILAFYVASASYRAFRARSLEAGLLLFAAVVVMAGRAPIGELLWRQFPVISSWLMDVPNATAQRGILIGASIGAFATSMRVLLGIDRGYLGGGE
jgi:hypothetical protein